MRVLVLSPYAQTVRGVAPFERVRSWVARAVTTFDNLFVEFILPEPGNELKYDYKGVKEYVEVNDRVRTHTIPTLKSTVNGWACSTLDLYNLVNPQRTTDMFYDTMLCGWSGISPILKSVIKNKFAPMNVDVPIINWMPTALIPEELDRQRAAFRQDFGYNRSMAEALSFFSDYAIFQTQTEYDIGLRNVKHWMAPYWAKQLPKHAIVSAMGAGPDCPAMDALYKKRKNKQKVTLGWGGRWASDKYFADVLKIFDTVAKTNDVDIVITTANKAKEPEAVELRKKYPHMTFHTGCNKQEFWKHLMEWDISLSLCEYEALGAATQEMLYGGVLVCCKKGQQLSVLPDPYPFVGKNNNEIVKIVTAMVKNLNKLRENYLPDLREHVRNSLSSQVSSERLHADIERVISNHYRNVLPAKGSLFNLVGKALKGVDKISFDAMCKRLQKNSKSNRDFGRKGDKIGRFYLRALAIANGYADTSTSEKCVLQRVDTPYHFGEVSDG